MISVRKSKKKIIIIQNNKMTYNLLKTLYLIFFIIASILYILKNNIGMVYINAIVCFVLYLLSIKISKIRKKVFIKLCIQESKIELICDKNKIMLDSIQKVIIKKERYGVGKFYYILKLKLIDEQEKFLLNSPYWKELNQVKKIILECKEGRKNEHF